MQTISTSVCSGRADRFSAIETIVVGLKKGVSHSRTSKPFKAYYYQVHSGQNYFSTNYNCRQNIDCKRRESYAADGKIGQIKCIATAFFINIHVFDFSGLASALANPKTNTFGKVEL